MNCPSLRIVSDNAADRAEISASPGAVPTLPVANLKTDIKTDVCRINSGNATLTCNWSTPEQVSCVVIPACNLSSESEIRAQVYSGPGTGLLHDTGWEWAAPGPILDNWDFTQPLNVNSFIEGATVVAVWLPEHYMARRVVIQLSDPQRSYLDISRLVVGPDFKPRVGASYGSALDVEDMSTASRAASGDMRLDRGPSIESMALDVNHVDPADRHRFARILRAGVGKYHFVSALPDSPDVTLEQDYMIYGVIQPAPLAFVTYGSHATQYVIRRF